MAVEEHDYKEKCFDNFGKSIISNHHPHEIKMMLIGNRPADILQWLEVPIQPLELWVSWLSSLIFDNLDDLGDDDDHSDQDDLGDDQKVQECIRSTKPNCDWKASLCRGSVEKGHHEDNYHKENGSDDDDDGDVSDDGDDGDVSDDDDDHNYFHRTRALVTAAVGWCDKRVNMIGRFIVILILMIIIMIITTFWYWLMI